MIPLDSKDGSAGATVPAPGPTEVDEQQADDEPPARQPCRGRAGGG